MEFDPEAICCGGPFFLLGLFLIYNGASQYLVLQKIRNTPTSKIRSIALGLVEVFGKAKSKIESISPISKIKSPYWLVIAKYYQSGKNGGWKEFLRVSSQNTFYLEDETGKIETDPKNSDLKIAMDKSFQGHLSKQAFLGIAIGDQIDKMVLDFIGELDESSKKAFDFHKNSNLSVEEYYIAENDQLYVLGTAMLKLDSNSSVQEENLIIGASPSDNNIMIISDSHEKNVEISIRDSILWSTGAGFILSTILLLYILSTLN